MISMPYAAKIPFASFMRRMFNTSSFSFSTTSVGVPAGASNPYQALDSNFGIVSLKVGISGAA